MDVARLAVDVQELRGELQLVTSGVSQRVDVLTTAVNNVQFKLDNAQEDRMKVLTLLTQLTERTAAIPSATTKAEDLEKKFIHWRGFMLGCSALAALIVTVVVAFAIYRLDAMESTIKANSARIEALRELKP